MKIDFNKIFTKVKQHFFTVFCALIIVCVVCGLFTRTNIKYDYAIVNLGNGNVIEGPLDEMPRYQSCNTITVNIEGTFYTTNSENIVLIDQ